MKIETKLYTFYGFTKQSVENKAKEFTNSFKQPCTLHDSCAIIESFLYSKDVECSLSEVNLKKIYGEIPKSQHRMKVVVALFVFVVFLSFLNGALDLFLKICHLFH